MKCSSLALLFSVVALGISILGYLAEPPAADTGALPGKGLAAYDMSTPRAALVAHYAMSSSGDMQAMVELSQRMQSERNTTFEIVEEKDYKAGHKVIFVTYMEDGRLAHDAQGMKRLDEGPIWVPDYVSSYGVRKEAPELADAIEAWTDKSAKD